MSPERWQQLAQLFDEALELEPQRRAAFLDEACAADAALRREVETLLASRERAGEFLQRDAFEDEAERLAAASPTLQPGQTLAHFEIQGLLGAGAMGEVYRARDTRLERQVALKLLPARFLQDAGRLRRFAREARAVSALNHPNIITVFDIGQDNGRPFIAAEYVAGETLRERLLRGPLPFAEAAAIAKQIGAALAAAHAAGIVHRDIKPENVMVRADGVVKVLDFGIAKLLSKDEDARLKNEKNAGSQLYPSSSIPHPSTEHGTVIGTPGYMSPEQARGLAVDARTDIFSLGVVLYEMLAGQAPFRGATSADIIVALLGREPEPLGVAVPVGTEALLARMLAKEVAGRYSTVAECLHDLEASQAGRGQRGRAGKYWRNQALRGRVVGVVLIAVFLLGTLLAWRYMRNFQEAAVWAPLAKLHPTKLLSTKLGLAGELSRPAFSPDGRLLAYTLRGEGESRLWIRARVGGTPRVLLESPWNDSDPLWSPDGQRLAFCSNRTDPRGIWTISSAGGAPVLLKELDAVSPVLVAWGRQGQGETLYYEAEHNLFALDLASGQRKQLTQFDAQRSRVKDFSLAPDQQQLVYKDMLDGKYCVLWQSLKGGAPVMLASGEIPYSAPVWFPDGQRIAFCVNRTGNLQVHVLRVADRQIEQVTFDDDNYSELAVAPDGQALVAVSARENANITALDLQSGLEEEHTSEFGLQVLPQLAPDGQRLIFQTTGTSVQGEEALFIKPNLPKSQARQLAAAGYNARWSPDGQQIAFIRYSSGAARLWRINAEGQDERQLSTEISPTPFSMVPFHLSYQDFAWSPDSQQIAYCSRKTRQSNLWRVGRDGAPDTQVSANTDPQTSLSSPLWSPDGQQIAYLSRTVGRNANRSVWLAAAGQNVALWQSAAPLKLLGWLSAGRQLLLAVEEGNSQTLLKQVTLLRLDIASRRTETLLQAGPLYPYSLTLAADSQSLVWVAREQGRDNLELFNLKTRARKRLTDNRDPNTFYAGLSWASPPRRVFYSKQVNWRFLTLIEHRP